MHNSFKMSTKKIIIHMDLSSDLLYLDKIEENNENLKLSTFYKFQSEQIMMNKKVNVKENIQLTHSLLLVDFTCTSKAAPIVNKWEKNMPFALIPEKRTILDVNKKWQFRVFSALKILASLQYAKEIIRNVKFWNKQEFHTGFSVHWWNKHLCKALVPKQKCIFRPSHNECNSLANSILVFLMSTLTGKNYL